MSIIRVLIDTEKINWDKLHNLTKDRDGYFGVDKNGLYYGLTRDIHTYVVKFEDEDVIECTECDGEGFCDYARGEDSFTDVCDFCNKDGGYNEDDDRDYDAWKDAQLEGDIEE